MSQPLSPAIERFLAEFEKTKGYGELWDLEGDALLRSLGSDEEGNPFCCPLTVRDQLSDDAWERCLPEGMTSDEGLRIANGADCGHPEHAEHEPEIRARLLAAVGLA